MLSYLNSATEWLQRKALHYVLKSKLGEFFEDECDIAKQRRLNREHIEPRHVLRRIGSVQHQHLQARRVFGEGAVHARISRS